MFASHISGEATWGYNLELNVKHYNWTVFLYLEYKRPKQITSPDWMHETSAQTWCTGKT